MNRLTKPSSFVLISCVLLSTILSFVILKGHIYGEILEKDISFQSISLHLGINLNHASSLASTIVGSIVLLAMVTSYLILDRKKGYIRFFVSLGGACAVLLTLVLNGDIFNALLKLAH